MLILLPPSEGKTAPAGESPLDPGDLAFARELGEKRERLMDALAELAREPRESAVEALGVSPGQAGEIDRNAGLRTAPAGPAAEVYSGVLYDRLDLPNLSPDDRRRADASMLIASALWGFVRPRDRIPYYRFSMKAKLPGIGGLAAFWRRSLTEAMGNAGHDREGGLVLDMRSGAYSAAWKPKRARLVAVRGFTETNGKRKAISHMAKAIRGDVARVALTAAELPPDLETLASLLEGEGMVVELTEKNLDVIERG